MAIVALAALLLPRLFVARDTRSHASVILGIVKSAALLVALGFALFVYLDDRQLSAALVVSGERVIWLIYWWIFQSSLILVLVWAPLLALVWIGMAKRVER